MEENLGREQGSVGKGGSEGEVVKMLKRIQPLLGLKTMRVLDLAILDNCFDERSLFLTKKERRERTGSWLGARLLAYQAIPAFRSSPYSRYYYILQFDYYS